MIESFYEKELLLSKLCTSYYLERDSHIRDKVKVELDLNATKKNYTILLALIYLIQLLKKILWL